MQICGQALKLAAILAVATGLAQGQGRARRIWYRISQAAFLAGSSADIGTSWGKYERNRLLRGPDGTIGWRGTTIKLGVSAALIAVEELLVRRDRRAEIPSMAANFTAAGVAAMISKRNMDVERVDLRAGPRGGPRAAPHGLFTSRAAGRP